MLDVSHVVSLSYYLVICVALRWIYLVLTQFWWMERGSKPELVYKSGSKHVQRIVQACSTLRERYEAKLVSTDVYKLFKFICVTLHQSLASYLLCMVFSFRLL